MSHQQTILSNASILRDWSVSGERASILGSIWLRRIILGDHPLSKTKDIPFLIVDYCVNAIFDRPSLNAFGAIVSTVHLCVKFQTHDNQIATVHSDKIKTHKCYNESLKTRPISNHMPNTQTKSFEVNNISDDVDLDPREDLRDGPSPIDELEQVTLNDNSKHFTYISYFLPTGAKHHIVSILQRNADLFTWTSAYMPGIDLNFISHKLQLDPNVRPIAQKKRNMGEEKKLTCLEQTQKFLNAGFIRELRFTTWLSNVVMVRKPSGATYQRLMDKIFSKQMGKNLEVYVDDMVVKTTHNQDHGADLEEIFGPIKKHNMRLNFEKCAFRVTGGKFLGFMLTARGIEANLEKCEAIIKMKSPQTIKEVNN
ncbi:uncharacterized protein [Arachis hypogaea]|uniref:uncharacterized protein n=1 Tax=Arachis hypogaea TaxID=3818 RepID=UPI003B218CD7